MLGYIQPFKPELKCKELDIYKAIYCGLCKSLGKLFGGAARLTLSYDFAFLALLHMSVNDTTASFNKSPCIAHPYKKTPYALSNEAIEYSAMTAAMTIYYKLKDNIIDHRFFGKLPSASLLPFAKSAFKKASKAYPELAEEIGKYIAQQATLEREGCASLDQAAEPTAMIMAAIAQGISQDEKQRFVLNRFGYQLGRWIYFTDALDDMEEDRKSRSYNPLLMQNIDDIDKVKELARGSINLTAGEMSLCYSLLRLGAYKPILDNILYLGLPNTLEKIIQGRKDSRNEQRSI